KSLPPPDLQSPASRGYAGLDAGPVFRVTYPRRPKTRIDGWNIQPILYMKTPCLGGSFNPIHHGHLICARAVAETSGFERVLLIPTGQPPHKPDFALADGSDRLEMCRLAIKNEEFGLSKSNVLFEVSDIELTRSGPSYTLDTVRELKKSGWPKVHWL